MRPQPWSRHRLVLRCCRARVLLCADLVGCGVTSILGHLPPLAQPNADPQADQPEAGQDVREGSWAAVARGRQDAGCSAGGRDTRRRTGWHHDRSGADRGVRDRSIRCLATRCPRTEVGEAARRQGLVAGRAEVVVAEVEGVGAKVEVVVAVGVGSVVVAAGVGILVRCRRLLSRRLAGCGGACGRRRRRSRRRSRRRRRRWW
jgi:hypothetical protein